MTDIASSRLVLGVDGGGTKTEAVAASIDAEGGYRVLGRGRAGAGNLLLAGRDVALRSLEDAVGAALGAVPSTQMPVDSAVLALAGVSGERERAIVTAWADGQARLGCVDIVSDWEPVLVSGTSEGWGVALIAGTGSIAVGRDRDGRVTQRGGWGHWFGDFGSGFDLGRRALAAIALGEDGLAPRTALAASVLEHFGVDNPRMIASELVVRDDQRQRIAALAPLVFDAAAAGDAQAERILTAGVDELVVMVTAIAEALALEPGYPLALAGSILCRRSDYRSRLEARLSAGNHPPGVVTPVPEPVMGAVALAKRRLDYDTPGSRSQHA